MLSMKSLLTKVIKVHFPVKMLANDFSEILADFWLVQVAIDVSIRLVPQLVSRLGTRKKSW